MMFLVQCAVCHALYRELTVICIPMNELTGLGLHLWLDAERLPCQHQIRIRAVGRAW
jgi:hypothetical protein